jgi:hypothetical protein
MADHHADRQHETKSLIREHVESLFDAFLLGDRSTLRAGRLSGWTGFQIQSTHLINGVDEYMSELEKALSNLHVERYEFLDFDVEVLDDVALVFYVARDWLAPGDKRPETVLIRALDVYRRIDGEWIQAASNISSIADERE